MSCTTASDERPPQPGSARYRIRIRGHIDPDWSTWFDCLAVARADDGTTELTGPVVDQAALFGRLARLRDLGATLLLVEHLPAAAIHSPPATHIRYRRAR